MLKMVDNNKKTLEMSLEERAQLEGQIAAENLRQTVYQAPAGYQTPVVHSPGLFDDEPLPHSPDLSEMSPSEQIGYWGGMLKDLGEWMVGLNSCERFENEYIARGMLDSGLLSSGYHINIGKRDYKGEMSQLRLFQSEIHYLRGLARKEAGDSFGALKDFADASKIAPDNPEYQKELRRILKKSMIMVEE